MGGLKRGGRSCGVRPGRPGKVGIDRLPVLSPEIAARTQRHEPAEVRLAADAAEIVIASEVGCLSLMEQTQEDTALAACGRLPIEPGQMATAGGAKQRLGRPLDQRAFRQPSLYGFPVHAQAQSVVGDPWCEAVSESDGMETTAQRACTRE